MKQHLAVWLMSVALGGWAATMPIHFNSTFALDSEGKPEHWQFNQSPDYQPLGTATVVAQPDGSNALVLKSTGKPVGYEMNEWIKVHSGDTLIFKAMVSGKGKFQFACSFYDFATASTDQYRHTQFENAALTDKPSDCTVKMAVRDDSGKGGIDSGRMYLYLTAGSEVTVSKLEAYLEQPDPEDLLEAPNPPAGD